MNATRTGMTHAPPGVTEPATYREIARVLGINERTPLAWAKAGELGKPVGKAATAGRPQPIYDWLAVLDLGMKAGRVNRDWDRLDPQGHIEGAAGSPGLGPSAWAAHMIPVAPTTDFAGRVYYFTPHAAARLGVPVKTLETWRTREHLYFPDPDTVIFRKHTWFEPTLVRWGKLRGRLDEEGNPKAP